MMTMRPVNAVLLAVLVKPSGRILDVHGIAVLVHRAAGRSRRELLAMTRPLIDRGLLSVRTIAADDFEARFCVPRSRVIKCVKSGQKLWIDVPHLAGMRERWRDMRIIPGREFLLITFPTEATMPMNASFRVMSLSHGVTGRFMTDRFATWTASKPLYASRPSWRSWAAFG